MPKITFAFGWGPRSQGKRRKAQTRGAGCLKVRLNEETPTPGASARQRFLLQTHIRVLAPSRRSAILTKRFPPRSPRRLLRLLPSCPVSRQLEGVKGREAQSLPLVAHSGTYTHPHTHAWLRGRLGGVAVIGAAMHLEREGCTLDLRESPPCLLEESCFLCHCAQVGPPQGGRPVCGHVTAAHFCSLVLKPTVFTEK